MDLYEVIDAVPGHVVGEAHFADHAGEVGLSYDGWPSNLVLIHQLEHVDEVGISVDARLAAVP